MNGEDKIIRDGEILIPKKVIADGGYAFPTDRNAPLLLAGMTLRDYYAGQALQGVLALMTDEEYMLCEVYIAERSYIYADAMIKARGHDEKRNRD